MMVIKAGLKHKPRVRRPRVHAVRGPKKIYGGELIWKYLVYGGFI